MQRPRVDDRFHHTHIRAGIRAKLSGSLLERAARAIRNGPSSIGCASITGGVIHSRPCAASGSVAEGGGHRGEGVDSRADVVDKTRQRQLSRAHTAADGRFRLEHEHAPAGGGDHDGRRQTVRARPDHDRIVVVGQLLLHSCAACDDRRIRLLVLALSARARARARVPGRVSRRGESVRAAARRARPHADRALRARRAVPRVAQSLLLRAPRYGVSRRRVARASRSRACCSPAIRCFADGRPRRRRGARSGCSTCRS